MILRLLNLVLEVMSLILMGVALWLHYQGDTTDAIFLLVLALIVRPDRG